MGRDITERRRSEMDLLESETRYRNLVEHSPDAIIVYSEDHVVFANAAAARLFAATRAEDLLGRLIFDLIHPDLRGLMRQRASRSQEKGQSSPLVEQKYVRFDGVAFDAEVVTTGIIYQGKPAGQVQLRDVTERKKAQEALRHSEERLRTLVENVPVLFYSYDAQGVYTLAEGSCLKLIGSEPGANVGRSVFDVYKDNPEILENARRVLSGETVHTTTQIKGLTFDARMQPLRDAEGRVTGAIGVATDITQQHHIEQENRQLHADLMTAYDNALNAYDATIEGWSRALDLRDHETDGHSRRVTEMTMLLAQAVGVPEEQMIHVRRGALLHDIGKMGVPDRILLKPGPLDEAEWEIMRRHPVLAREMLAPTEFLHPALDIPYCHHEKWDGTGYPQGLCGTEIPLPARLFALVDVWDALPSDRPYRKAWPRERVLDHLRSLAGTHFDPEIVPVFLHLLAADVRPHLVRLAA